MINIINNIKMINMNVQNYTNLVDNGDDDYDDQGLRRQKDIFHSAVFCFFSYDFVVKSSFS